MKILRFKIFFQFLIISNSVGSNVEFEWANSDRHWSVPWTQRSSERRSLWGRDGLFLRIERSNATFNTQEIHRKAAFGLWRRNDSMLLRKHRLGHVSSVHNKCWVWASPILEILGCSHRLLINVLIKFYGWFRWYLRTILALNYKHWNYMYRINRNEKYLILF